MTQTTSPRPPFARPRLQLFALSPLLVLALLLGSLPSTAATRDEEYMTIFEAIQQADSLRTDGSTNSALAKYRQAETALLKFRAAYPDFNVKAVGFRLNYVAEKIDAASAKETVVAPAGASSTGVRLLEAGAEPRKVLRLHPAAGDKQTMNMVMKMAMDMNMGQGQSQSIKLPAMNMTMETTVKEVSGDGDVTYDLVLGDCGVAEDQDALPQVVEAMKSALAGLKGLSGSGKISSRGIVKAADIKIPSGAAPQVRQTMEQMKDSIAGMSSPLPEEPVGAGAKWENKTPVKTQGMNLEQTVTYELVSINGEQFTTKGTIIQAAANQKVQSPAMPGMKVDLSKMTGRGTAERTSDLNRLLPLAATVQTHSEFTMGVNAGGQNQSIDMKMDMNVKMESK